MRESIVLANVLSTALPGIESGFSQLFGRSTRECSSAITRSIKLVYRPERSRSCRPMGHEPQDPAALANHKTRPGISQAPYDLALLCSHHTFYPGIQCIHSDKFGGDPIRRVHHPIVKLAADIYLHISERHLRGLGPH